MSTPLAAIFQRFVKFATAYRCARSSGLTPTWVIGAMPPPVNGQSKCNAEMAKFFSQHRPTIVVSTGTSALAKISQGIVLPLIIIFFVRRRDIVYASPPGQNGLWIFLLSVLFLRIRRVDYWVHHHSFRAINSAPMMSWRIMCRLGGVYQRHIFLSERMMARYSSIYLSEGQKLRARVLPNSYFFAKGSNHVPNRRGPITLGHLSVMTPEKGIYFLLHVFEALLQLDQDVRLTLAGPVADQTLKDTILSAVERHPSRIHWVGPVYNDAKESFYRNLDLFIFPTTLIDEADPLVIVEAYSWGCDVMASDTGCIAERLRDKSDVLSLVESDDLILILNRVRRLRIERFEVGKKCIDHAHGLHTRSLQNARDFFSELKITI